MTTTPQRAALAARRVELRLGETDDLELVRERFTTWLGRHRHRVKTHGG
jgi:hypothetical protein